MSEQVIVLHEENKGKKRDPMCVSVLELVQPCIGKHETRFSIDSISDGLRTNC